MSQRCDCMGLARSLSSLDGSATAVSRNGAGNGKIFLQGDPVSNALDSYSLSAQYYDPVYAEKPSLEDVPFYLELAKRIGGPVLELACGTGRVLLPIARAGIAIHGVDNSVPMLNVLSKNLKREAKDVRELVSMVR